MSDTPPDTDYQFPSSDYESALRRMGRLVGVQDTYWDIWGRQKTAGIDVERAILETMGVSAGTLEELDESARRWLARERFALLPVCAVTAPAESWVLTAIPEGGFHTGLLEVQLEDGVAMARECALDSLHREETADFDGCHYLRLRFPLPENLPFGYHSAQLTLRGAHGERRVSCPLLHCPDRMFEPSAISGGARRAGVAISLYGLRSESNWGCGDFTDLARFSRWAQKETGAAFIALNPLHAIANRSPYNTSPYLPASTFFRNFLYLDVEAVAEWSLWPGARKLREKLDASIAKLRSAELVDYEGVSRIKLVALKWLYRCFLRGSADRRAEFDAYRKSQGSLLRRFAVYLALDGWLHRRDPNVWIFQEWPEEFQNPASDAVAAFAQRHWQRVEFWEYVLWLVDQQAAAAHQAALASGMAVGLYHDLALATDRCGSDLWGYGEYYARGCRVGSPPDDFAPNGQDWSFPPPEMDVHRAEGYRLFAAAIRNNARHGGALRIDHVMRFFRLFWIPEGKEASEGTFVRERWRDLLRIVALESHRNQVMVIGEDLGTVEHYVREGLEEFGVFSYRLLYFERGEGGRFRKPGDYPHRSIVSSTTHDLPTLAGWWTGRDIDLRRETGMIAGDDSYKQQIAARLEDKHKLVEVLFDLNLLPGSFPRDAAKTLQMSGDIHNAVIGFLASANSQLFVLNQEDLTKETEQQNLPGSTWEYPNWRRKMRYTLEQLESEPQVHDFAQMLRSWLQSTSRL